MKNTPFFSCAKLTLTVTLRTPRPQRRFRWWFIPLGLLALVLLALGLVRVYRRPRLACADGDTCARPLPARGMKVVLWASLALVILAVAFPYVAPLFIPA